MKNKNQKQKGETTMKEEMLEEIIEYADGLETEEELLELCNEMEERWMYRRIEYKTIEAVIEAFKEELNVA